MQMIFGGHPVTKLFLSVQILVASPLSSMTISASPAPLRRFAAALRPDQQSRICL
jgi:hypothetical protein